MTDLKLFARQIFRSALQAVDARAATRNAITLYDSRLKVVKTEIDISSRTIYVIGLGKAAYTMAAGLRDALGDRINRGIISGPRHKDIQFPGWQTFTGGHPLPTNESLAAAQAALHLLKAAEENALVIFLVSGGGSAMFELPSSKEISLADLREANRQLVACGAAINQVNAVRRAFSAIKGGKLALSGPQTDQVTLIVSDTNPGDVANVASGPTIAADEAVDAAEVTKRYGLENTLPKSVLNAIANSTIKAPNATSRLRQHYVLLDNATALQAAAEKAKELGFAVEIVGDINEQQIDEGCDLLLSRAQALWNQSDGKSVCLLSGGEFSCPVRGDGVGGRNLETVLRCAIKLDKVPRDQVSHWAVLSAGTDGIDGSSDAAGAVADETTLSETSRSRGDAEEFLKRSDSFHFFETGDLIVTGPTGTNVSDFRVVLIGSPASRD